MRRRNFMILGSIIGISPYLSAQSITLEQKRFAKIKKTIATVQAHMLPDHTALPSARSMHTIDFLEETIFHSTYDRDIRRFVIDGAEELERREGGKFTTYDTTRKEKALRAYETDSYGSNWLSRIMTLSMEAMLGDPIYGSNIGESGWKAVESFGGLPRPRTRYMGR